MLEMKEVAHMIEGRLVDGGNVTRLVLGFNFMSILAFAIL